MKQLIFTTYLLMIGIISFNSGLSSPINPYINSVSPPLNANSVVKSSNIVITFEQVMNGSTMINDNVKVFGYQTGLMNVSLDFNSVENTLTINPLNQFKNGEIISVTLTAGIKTISNQNISPHVFKFRAKALGGTGSFNLSSEISNTVDGYIRSGDIDRDGDIDLVINNAVYMNNGNAFFNISESLNHQGRPDMFDADNDGDLDILISNNGTFYYYKNDGVGNFLLFSVNSGSIWGFGDLSGNGYIDIAYYINTRELMTKMNTNGIFNPGMSYNLPGQCNINENYYDNLLFDDFNNDGGVDIISISGWVGGVSITGYDLCRKYNQLTNDGIGDFSVQTVFNNYIEGAAPFIFDSFDSKSFDVNEDGLVDIASPYIEIRNNGNGSYTQIGDFGFPFSNSLDFDANGNGFIDLCVNFNGALMCFNNNGTGVFTLTVAINNLNFSSGSASGDFDNDGDIDIAFKEYNNDKVAILLNGDSPLPVELSSFTSSINQNSVKLNWTTSQEQNNSGFEIERSDNSSNVQGVWKKIDFINGVGNSNTQNNYSFEDKNLTSGKYKYRLKQIDFNGSFEYHELSTEVVIGIPSSTELMQNYPNPFNPVTNISYRLSENGFVTLRVFDNSGREVKTLINEFKEAGYYTNEFNGSDLASGIYFYKLAAGNFVQTKKLSLVK